MRNVSIVNGDCLQELRGMADSSVDSIVTDPPYGLANATTQKFQDALAKWVHGDREYVPSGRGFMGKDWDSFVPPPAVWDECLRVLKPGGHMAVFAGARTQDLMGLSIRLAGFEIRDTLGWIYGSGFPKSMDVSKAIDKAAGAEREVVGRRVFADGTSARATAGSSGIPGSGAAGQAYITTPATSEAERWDGWGTALKPAIEPIILARKPLDGTVAANVLAHGVGGLNIDACRIETTDDLNGGGYSGGTPKTMFSGLGRKQPEDFVQPAGRFPANVLLDEHAAKEMDRQSGVSVSNVREPEDKDDPGATFSLGRTGVTARGHADSGGASRFFPVFKYQAKAPKKERPVIVREDGTKIQHPTVKPVALMEWLVTLITPEGGLTLDPFAGSGATLQAAINKGFHVIGIERDGDYCKLIKERLKEVLNEG